MSNNDYADDDVILAAAALYKMSRSGRGDELHRPPPLPSVFKCWQCDMELPNSPALRAHLARHHPAVADHTCDVCGKTFDTGPKLGGHKTKHRNERSPRN